MAGDLTKALNQVNQPVYGSAQQAQVLNNLNNLANSSISNLQANLARTGGLQSGQLGQGITNIDIAKMGSAANFEEQIPLLNYNAMLQGMGVIGGLGNQFMGVAPKTQTTNQYEQKYGSNTGTGYQQTTQNPSIMSDIGQVAGMVMGMPNFGGGGGGGGNPSGWVDPNDVGQFGG